MVSPSTSSAQYRPDLRDVVAEEWSVTGEAAAFVANRAVPLVDVPNAAGTHKRIAREEFTKDEDDTRAPDGTSRRVAFGSEDVTYNTIERSLEVPVDRNMANQAREFFNAEVQATRIVLSKLRRAHEKRCNSLLFNASTFSGYTGDVDNAWSTAASGTPIADIREAAENVRKACGIRANTALMARDAWEALIATTEALNRVTGAGSTLDPAHVLPSTIAALCDLQEVIIADPVQDSANRGQSFSGASLWTTTMCLVYYRNPMASFGDPQCCMTYHWGGDGSERDYRIETYNDESVRGDIVRGRRQDLPAVPYKEMGYLLTTVTA